jgi:glutamyl-tRNA synthetase
VELAENAIFYARSRPLVIGDKAAKFLDQEGRERLRRLQEPLGVLSDWTAPGLDETVRAFAESEGVKLGKIAQPLRAALTGSTFSPGIFDVLEVLGRRESLGRLDDAVLGDP